MKTFSILLATVVVALVWVSCGGSSGSDAIFLQVDRMGVSAVNSALIPSGMKDDFNLGDPSTDPNDFLDTIIATITALRGAVASVPGFPAEDSPGVSAEAVAGIVNPDVINIDLSMPTVFPNGRGLEDDTIDPILGLVLNRGSVLSGGPGISDGVANDSPALSVFPFAAPPQ